MAQKVGSVAIATVVSNTNVEVLPPSESRCRVAFKTGIQTTAIYVSNKPMTAVGQGMQLTSSGPYIELDEEQWGTLVKGPWSIFGATAGDTVIVVEALKG